MTAPAAVALRRAVQRGRSERAVSPAAQSCTSPLRDRRLGFDPVTVAVLGPGAVGTVLAVPLARAGFRVVCVGREETVREIEREGLTLVRHGEVLTAKPEAVTELVDNADLLLVTVKAFALDDA